MDMRPVVEKPRVAERIVFEGPLYASLPVQWGPLGQDGHNGPPVQDPLTIEVSMPALEGEEVDGSWQAIYRITLGELLSDALDLDLDPEPVQQPKEEFILMARRVAGALREQADRIEAAIPQAKAEASPP